MNASSTLDRALACTNPTGELGAAQNRQLSERALLASASAGQTALPFQLHRYPVSEALSPWLDFHWLIEWDLPAGQEHSQRVLPYPNTHLVFEAGATALHGVARGVFVRGLHGRGRVHGLRFKCGGLRPWLNGSVQALSGRQVLLGEALAWAEPAHVLRAEQAVLGAGSHRQAIKAAEALLLGHLPAMDPWVARVDAAVQQVMQDSSLTRVAELQALLGLTAGSERTLQRRFADSLGVSPKWVIQRARLQDALQALAQEQAPGFADLALHLGFCDQAHFSRCFRQTTGQTPAQYRLALARSMENSHHPDTAQRPQT
ncbi:helix-turn-helix domain-containing protein [Roseateles oligotrophus]|uniref:Helix-turn-helix domain-containing protein n=1 Tax=Roseateles oligotrophus TaxID=1769250 RepID=A0ABT2YIU9_9BURK|nr:helix-turn-helix domain-containing protein [Roseateles oligotrophus]MCV2369958.1 helix-turn-helix domain-containing protein [Roseateles oligotrophus]